MRKRTKMTEEYDQNSTGADESNQTLKVPTVEVEDYEESDDDDVG